MLQSCEHVNKKIGIEIVYKDLNSDFQLYIYE